MRPFGIVKLFQGKTNSVRLRNIDYSIEKPGHKKYRF
jgi:hypothetical protein